MIDNLLDLIKYHDGQIVSRSLSKKLKKQSHHSLCYASW